MLNKSNISHKRPSISQSSSSPFKLSTMVSLYHTTGESVFPQPGPTRIPCPHPGRVVSTRVRGGQVPSPRISDKCSNHGIDRFTKRLSEWSGSQGYCVEIGDGPWASWFTPLEDQAQIVCDKVKKMKELKEGYSIVGLSQGSLIGRGVIQFCEGGPPVKNLISLGGPHAGIASVPLCGSGILCIIADELIKFEIYSDYVQDHFAPSGYLKIPSNMDGYLHKCKFLPKLNNEIPGERNSTYKKRFSSLENLVLIMFEDDIILVPKETAWFGYYPDGCFTPLLAPQKTKLYTEDWIGLKTLDAAGRVKFVSVAGGHLRISTEDMKKHIVPYLKSQVPNTYKVRGERTAPTVK